MSKPVNLNRARKAKARKDAKQQADENAVRFGRTKAEKNQDRATQEKATRDLDGHKRE